MTPEQTQEEWEDEIISDSCFHQEGKKMQLKLRSIVRTARLKAVAQFDAMLAEDIEKMPKEKNRHDSDDEIQCALVSGFSLYRSQALSILEARRLSLKK